jgi:hypothetical protein
MKDYPKEQLRELYDNLPDDLQEAVFSEEKGEMVVDICKENGIDDDNVISQVLKSVGYVFLGLVSPDEFENFLKEEVGIKMGAARQIALRIKRDVFMPLKKSLELLYNIEIKMEEDIVVSKSKRIGEKEDDGMRKKDLYREPIE